MPIVRVIEGVFINVDQVGLVRHFSAITQGKRTMTTIIHDRTGQNVLFKHQTEIDTTAPDHNPDAVTRDNHYHDDIIRALRHGTDAMPYQSANPV